MKQGKQNWKTGSHHEATERDIKMAIECEACFLLSMISLKDDLLL